MLVAPDSSDNLAAGLADTAVDNPVVVAVAVADIGAVAADSPDFVAVGWDRIGSSGILRCDQILRRF